MSCCDICTFFFGDAVALLRESYTFGWRLSYVSYSYLIEVIFLDRDVKVYSLFGRFGKCSCLRAIPLTVLRVVYAIVRLSEDVP